MVLRITESRVETSPLPKTLSVGGKEIGEVKPFNLSDGTAWRAAVRFRRGTGYGMSVSGFGITILDAIADAIITARRERDGFVRELQEIERSLGTDIAMRTEPRSAAGSIRITRAIWPGRRSARIVSRRRSPSPQPGRTLPAAMCV